MCREQAEASAEEVADDTVDNEDTIDLVGRGEAFTAGQVTHFSVEMMPLF